MAIKYGWTIYDPDGVCSASVKLYVPNSGWRTVWSFKGSATTTRVSGKYRWNAQIATYQELSATATDCLGNTGSDYGYADASLYQEGSASYSAGWASGTCSCWSGGTAFKSSTAGAKAHFSFSGRLVTLISDKGSSRGKAALYIDGVYKKTITLTSSTSVNRLLAWNSPYLSSGTHVLTVKVVSGRIDIDAFVTQ